MATVAPAAGPVGTGTATRRGRATTAGPVWQRLGRVLRHLTLVGLSVAVYYAGTTWLVERFGQRGLLYALLVLAATMALLREFGSDLAAIPGRIREALRRSPATVTQAPAADVGAKTGAAVAAPEPANRADAEARFRQESERLRNGELTKDEFQRFTQAFFFIDGHGKFWTIQSDTQKWAYFKEGEWHPGLPLGTLTTARMTQPG